jgi:hypothetical protein
MKVADSKLFRFIIDDADASDVEERYKATYTPTVDIATAKALKISPFRRNRHILTAKTLSDAVRGCDTYARTKVVPGPLVSGYVPLSISKLPCKPQEVFCL